MASPTGCFINYPSAIIQQIQSACLQATIAGFIRGNSYSIAGRNFSFSDAAQCAAIAAECQYALDIQSGNRSMNVRANFNEALGRGTGGGWYNPETHNQA